MSQAPFSKPDVNDVVSSSSVFKIHPSLNHWSGGRLPKARGKRLFGLVVIALLLLGLQLTACGNAAPSPTGSASPTSNSTSQPIIPSTTSAQGPTSASTTTAGPTTTVPTTGPTTGLTTTPTTGSTSTPTAVPTGTPTTGPTITPTAVPTAPPSSFTISLFQFFASGFVGQGNVDLGNGNGVITLTNQSSNGSIFWSVSTPTDSGGNWLGLTPPHSGTLAPNASEDHQITIFISNDMPPGTYTGHIQFNPLDPEKGDLENSVQVTLTVVPSVSGISPASGSAAGGTSVTITGSGFTGATGVLFGSTAASGFTVNSDTQITATSPAGSGTVDVTVTDSFGTSLTNNGDQFTYNSAPSGPVVSSISPTSGPAAGGTSVTITGTSFTGATAVSFGSTAASSLTVDSDTQITATSPAGSGTVDVTVTTPNGTSATGAADQFTYT